MSRYELHFVVSPTAPFGLPSGDHVVRPAGPQSIAGPAIHLRSRKVASHGTLPLYRADEDALAIALESAVGHVSVRDNFATVVIDAGNAEVAYQRGTGLVERLCQSLSVLSGLRFSAEFQFCEDDLGNVTTRDERVSIPVGTFTVYNLIDLAERFGAAFDWAIKADDRVGKALLYVEHAFILTEIAQSRATNARNAAFSRGLAFLQLFKALSLIVGEPGTDSDYQRRCRALGLPHDFWLARVKPLYDVRNDDDVAHYHIAPPDLGAFRDHFASALEVLREALDAYARHLPAMDRDRDA